MNEKRGQVSLFMIIGVVLLISALIIIFIRYSFQDEQSSSDIIDSINAKNIGKPEAEELIQECLKDTIMDGAVIMRLQGGFINIPSDYQVLAVPSNYQIYFDANGIKRIKQEKGVNFIPYYFTAVEGTNFPTTEELQNELRTYILKAWPRCVNKLDFVKNQYDLDIHEKSIDANVMINTTLTVEGKYQVEATAKDVKWTTEDFTYNIPISLQQMLIYSKAITYYQWRDAFIEHNIKEIISVHSFQGNTKTAGDLPPMSSPGSSGFQDTPKQWMVSTTSVLLKEYIADYIPFTKVEQSSTPRTFKLLTHPYFKEDKDYDIEFFYDTTWPIDVDIKPNEGGVLKPSKFSNSGISVLPTIENYEYNFKYDVKVPILVKVTDRLSVQTDLDRNLITDGNASFYFVLEGYLCGNQPQGCRFSNYKQQNLDNVTNQDYGYCDHADSHEIDFKVTDFYSKKPIENALVGYRCGDRHNDCTLGYTDANGIVRSKIQTCTNGQLYVDKVEYANREKRINTSFHSLDGVKQINISTEPLKELQVAFTGVNKDAFIKAHYLTNGFTSPPCGNASKDIRKMVPNIFFEPDGERDQILLTIKDKNTDYTEVVAYPKKNYTKLYAGEFEFKTNYLSNITVYPSTINSGGQTYTIGFAGSPPNYENYTGNWEIGKTDFDFEIVPLEFDTKSHIIYYVLTNFVPWKSVSATTANAALLDQDKGISTTLKPNNYCTNTTNATITHRIEFGEWRQLLSPVVE